MFLRENPAEVRTYDVFAGKSGVFAARFAIRQGKALILSLLTGAMLLIWAIIASVAALEVFGREIGLSHPSGILAHLLRFTNLFLPEVEFPFYHLSVGEWFFYFGMALLAILAFGAVSLGLIALRAYMAPRKIFADSNSWHADDALRAILKVVPLDAQQGRLDKAGFFARLPMNYLSKFEFFVDDAYAENKRYCEILMRLASRKTKAKREYFDLRLGFVLPKQKRDGDFVPNFYFNRLGDEVLYCGRMNDFEVLDRNVYSNLKELRSVSEEEMFEACKTVGANGLMCSALYAACLIACVFKTGSVGFRVKSFFSELGVHVYVSDSGSSIHYLPSEPHELKIFAEKKGGSETA